MITRAQKPKYDLDNYVDKSSLVNKKIVQEYKIIRKEYKMAKYKLYIVGM